jgi:hypothetical protein
MWKAVSTALIISAAYLLAGLYFAWPAFRVALIRKAELPDECNSRPRVPHVVLLAASWLPVTLAIAICSLSATSLKRLRREVTSWLVFVVLLMVGLHFF